MLDKVLLTLDGSELAENAIPYARELAAGLEAEIFLLHACPQEHSQYTHMHQIYLNSIAEGLRSTLKDIRHSDWEPVVQAEVVKGEPVKVIFDYLKQKEINLTVLTACGTSGFRPWSIGKVADAVVRRSGIPSLLIRVKEGHVPPKRKGLIQKILLPLDNSEASQLAIPYAVYLAKKMGASITLFTMVQTIYAQNLDGINSGVSGGLAMNWDSVDAAAEKSAEEYLQNVEEDIRKSGIEVFHTVYLGIDAAYEILEMEKRMQADLIVMTTRGRSPIARWAFGSVAEKVLREGDKPILLIKEKESR